MLRPLFIHPRLPRDVRHRPFALDPHQPAHIPIGMFALVMRLRPKTDPIVQYEIPQSKL
jgi:hypothetical protein